MQKVTLYKNKEIFDMEIWEIFEVVKIGKQKYLKAQQLFIINIFCNSQHAINWIKVLNQKIDQVLKTQIYQKVKQ